MNFIFTFTDFPPGHLKDVAVIRSLTPFAIEG